MIPISAQVLSFQFNPYSLLSLIGIVGNLLLIYLILSRGIQNSANRWFSFFLFCLVLWGTGEFLNRLSVYPEGANFWSSVGAPGWVFMSIAFFNFTLAFVGKEYLVDSLIKKFLIYAPTIIFLYIVWNTNIISIHTIDTFYKVPWGWSSNLGSFFPVFILWLEFYFISSLVFLVRFYFHTADQIRKKQTLFLIVGLLIPLLGGTLTDAIVPIINLGLTNDIRIPGFAIVLTSVLGALATYSILRYKLFVINPATHFENIVRTMNEALIVFNLGNTIEFTNDTVERLFGFKNDELYNRNVETLLRGESTTLSFQKNLVEKLRSGQAVNGLELEFTSKSGETIPVNLSGTPIKDESGSLVGFVLLAADMREMKKLVYNLVAERNKLSITLSGVSEGVFVVDKEGIVTFINQAAEKIFNVRESDVLGKRADEIFNINDDDGKILMEYFFPKEQLSKDMVTFSRNGVKIERSDGQLVYVNLIAANIVESEGVNLGAIVTMHDVSKEKDLEEMKLDFVSMAAHELRTPLTSIRGYLSVLQEETKDQLSPELVSFLDKAFISSTQLAALVENLLSVSRIERGSLQIQSQITPWEPLVEEAFSNFLPQAKERKVTLTYVKPKSALPFVLVDKFRISEVVSNLVSNALNYTPAGGSVEISLESNKEEVITHVADTGPGIPSVALPKLFTKFFRVSGVLEQGSKGTGLGLYISKAIVDMHKGRIWVESELGKGSRFSFSVPVSLEQKLPEIAPGVPSSRKMFFRKSPKK